MRLLFCLLLVLLLVGCTVVENTPGTELISLEDTETGKELILDFRDTEKKVIQKLGKPYSANNNEYEYDHLKLQFKEGFLLQFWFDGARYKMKGIGVGSTLDEVEEAYGHRPTWDNGLEAYHLLYIIENEKLVKSEFAKHESSINKAYQDESKKLTYYILIFNLDENNKINGINVIGRVS
ncbi:hypothetical protein [Caldalkalibacillus mannanilyticus]|uniref:hypothetical protein n=1 Tax=Caldalkalibacillus mannanilyticus TaxID=1418 RepID=UPI0004687542|nr:hypothetical protein [Caldalkalibacillus mannanilyticus]